MRVNKGYIFVSLLLIIMTLSGCIRSSEHHITSYEAMTQKGDEMIEAIMSKDVHAVKESLCLYIQDTHVELEEQISGIFEFIDGEIVSFDEPNEVLASGHTIEEEWVERYITGEIKNIKTSTNQVYRIIYTYYLINKEQPEYLGITHIDVIVDGAERDPVKGYLPEEHYSIELEVPEE